MKYSRGMIKYERIPSFYALVNKFRILGIYNGPSNGRGRLAPLLYEIYLYRKRCESLVKLKEKDE